jgi:hypothetical protein
MIQRIQTLYLAIAAALTAVLFALPFAKIDVDSANYLYNVKGILLEGTVKQSGLIVAIVTALGLIIHLAAIFLFKNRILQKKIVLLGMISLTVLFGLIAYTAYFSFSGAKISLQTGFIFPLISIIIDYLAIRGINKDEALIRSIDRIR